MISNRLQGEQEQLQTASARASDTPVTNTPSSNSSFLAENIPDQEVNKRLRLPEDEVLRKNDEPQNLSEEVKEQLIKNIINQEHKNGVEFDTNFSNEMMSWSLHDVNQYMVSLYGTKQSSGEEPTEATLQIPQKKEADVSESDFDKYAADWFGTEAKDGEPAIPGKLRDIFGEIAQDPERYGFPPDAFKPGKNAEEVLNTIFESEQTRLERTFRAKKNIPDGEALSPELAKELEDLKSEKVADFEKKKLSISQIFERHGMSIIKEGVWSSDFSTLMSTLFEFDSRDGHAGSAFGESSEKDHGKEVSVVEFKNMIGWDSNSLPPKERREKWMEIMSRVAQKVGVITDYTEWVSLTDEKEMREAMGKLYLKLAESPNARETANKAFASAFHDSKFGDKFVLGTHSVSNELMSTIQMMSKRSDDFRKVFGENVRTEQTTDTKTSKVTQFSTSQPSTIPVTKAA